MVFRADSSFGIGVKGNPAQGLVFQKTHQLIAGTPSGNPCVGFAAASQQEKHASFSSERAASDKREVRAAGARTYSSERVRLPQIASEGPPLAFLSVTSVLSSNGCLALAP